MAILWFIAMLVLMIIEITTTAFVAAFLALGAAAAAVAAALGVPPLLQVVVFALVAVLGVLLARPPLVAYVTRRQGPEVKSGAQAMIGERALVVDPIPGGIQRGHVRIAGETWPALSADESLIGEGSTVTILGLERATLVVRLDPSVPRAEQSGPAKPAR